MQSIWPSGNCFLDVAQVFGIKLVPAEVIICVLKNNASIQVFAKSLFKFNDYLFLPGPKEGANLHQRIH